MIYLLLGSWKVFSTTAAKGLAVMEVSPQDNKRVSFKRKSSQYHRNMQKQADTKNLKQAETN
jgi:hypothetical protein